MLDCLTRFPLQAANDEKHRRSRTVLIPETILPIPGYPSKLALFKMAASRYWQVRCWMGGRTYRRSTRTTSLREAMGFARRFYEQLIVAQNAAGFALHGAIGALMGQTPSARGALPTAFKVYAEQLYESEKARVERRELSRASLQVLRNRLDCNILPRFGRCAVAAIDFNALLDFVRQLSADKSTTTVSQYLVIMRKVLSHALHVGAIEVLPQFPAVKITTTPRGAFTPSEYWQIIRTARRLREQRHPLGPRELRLHHKLRHADQFMPPDLAWAIGFMVNSFIRPSDLKTLRHRHVEVVHGANTYLRLTLPETKKHDRPIVTLYPAVRIYRQLARHHGRSGACEPGDYLFLPSLKDRNYALNVLNVMFNWVLDLHGLKIGPHGQRRSLYSLRHSAITFRLLYGSGIDLLTLARNARTSVEVISNHYASTVTAEQNIALLQSRRKVS